MMEGIDFLTYEIWMMRQTSDRLTGDTEDAVIRNALLEAFLIHARALVGFFGERHKKDDIVATDYVSGWDEPVSRYLLAECDRINKQVAHLTTARHTAAVPQKEHDVAKIRRELDVLIDKFLAEIDPQLKSGRFDDVQVSVTFIQTVCTTSME